VSSYLSHSTYSVSVLLTASFHNEDQKVHGSTAPGFARIS